ncbi:MAG: acetylornithine transaminase [Thermoanaerobacterales bacterium]|nr:acetylornithine transaminase [Thermoanaerobacterales bacterium]
MRQNEIIAFADRYLMRTYGRLPIVVVRGDGVWVWDAEGKKYLDFVAGIAVNAVGHCNPRVVEAVIDQARRLMHCSNLYYIEPQMRLARMLVDNSAFDRAFFCNSGAEAVEGAIKLARKYARSQGGEDRYEIIAAHNSFHGRTLGALTATGQVKYHKGFEPLAAGFKHVPFNDLEAMDAAINERTCAVLLEPIQGEGGINVPSKDYLQGVRRLCDARGALLILDEVQTGMGRTGRLFAHEHYGVVPDIIALAKALGGGFPIGAILAREPVASAFTPGDHASTFGGNPLACAAGIATLKLLLGEDYIGHAARVGQYFKARLADLMGRYPFIHDVRGRGLMLGMELTVPGGDIVTRCRDEGLLINCIGQKVLRFVPPLIVTLEDIDGALIILTRVLDEVKKEAEKA